MDKRKTKPNPTAVRSSKSATQLHTKEGIMLFKLTWLWLYAVYFVALNHFFNTRLFYNEYLFYDYYQRLFARLILCF